MSTAERTSVWKQAVRRLHGKWQVIAGAEYDAEAASMRPDLPGEDVQRLRKQMKACLKGHGGEVSARARAAALGRAYLALDATGRERFLELLAEDFDVIEDNVSAAIESHSQAKDSDQRRDARRRLRRALEAPRLKLLTQFNSLPEGIKFLVNMRSELLPLTKRSAALSVLDDDLRGLLVAWFDVDFLELKANHLGYCFWGICLERLIAYEAVHPIESWDDLKNRAGLRPPVFLPISTRGCQTNH